MGASDFLEVLGGLLQEGRRRFQVPGAVAAILSGGSTAIAADGFADSGTGQPVTAETVFPLYSIGKMFTATLAALAFEDGALTVSMPVRGLLPDFALDGAAGGEGITVRHLLTHSSGIPGDFLIDVGDDDGCIGRYVERCMSLRPFHRPGQLVSYSNAGFVVLGRLLEVAYGVPFCRLLTERLLDALGIPADGDRHPGFTRTHVAEIGTGRLRPGPPAPYPRALAPAGATIAMTARHLLAFAEAHLGRTRDGTGRPLPAARTRRDMQQLHAALPRGMEAAGFGLGWMIPSAPGLPRTIGHDGAGITFLRLLPDRNSAFVLLTNGGQAAKLFRHLWPQILPVLCPADPPRAAMPVTAIECDRRRYVGDFANLEWRLSVTRSVDGLSLRQTSVPGSTAAVDADAQSLVPIGRDLFGIGGPDGPRVAFFGRGEQPPWLQYGLRAFARQDGSRA